MAENVYSALELYESCKEDADEAQVDLRKAKQVLADVVASTPLDIELAWSLYWFSEVNAEHVGFGLTLAGVPNNGANSIHSVLQPGPVVAQCNSCSAPIRATSRSNLKDAKSALDGRSRFATAWEHRSQWSCDCLAQKKQQREQHYEENQKQRSEQLNSLKSMPYQQYLKTEHWQTVRRAALKRARFRCQVCNANAPLDVHHRTYENRGAEWASDVIALCRECHARHHGKLPE